MALVKFGGGVAALSGKTGGSVYARNRSGAYQRNWAKPVNPGSIRQEEVRAAFGSSASGWGLLSPTAKADWDALAAATERINRLGDTYVPTGRQLYMESSQNLSIVSISPLSAAPANLDPPVNPGKPVVSIVYSTGTIATLELQDLSGETDTSVIVESTGPVQNSKNNVNNVYRILTTAAATPTLDIEAAYVATFGGTPAPDTNIHFRVKYVNEINGMASTTTSNFTTVP